MAAILECTIYIENVNFVQDCTRNNPLAFAFILYIHVYVTYEISNMKRGRRGRDRMVVGFTTTFMQSVPITTKIVRSNPFHGEMYSIQHYVIKFVSDL